MSENVNTASEQRDIDCFIRWGNELTQVDPEFAQQIILNIIKSQNFSDPRPTTSKDIPPDA